MKKLLFSLGCFFLSGLGLFAQDISSEPDKAKLEEQTQETQAAVEESQEGPQIIFESSEYNFGTIKTGEKVSNTFVFSNTGTEDLLILGVQTSCGCTAPDWPKQPILPGEKGEIKVIFNSTGKRGAQNKTVTVKSNANNESSYRLVLRGEVTKEEVKQETKADSLKSAE